EFAEFDEEVTVLFTPNDPYYSTRYPSTHYGQVTQWALPDVSAPAAWDTTKGTSATVIAIVDTGIDATHPDLALKVIGQQSYVGNAKDGFGHGTHCAGIAAAATNNGTGVAGACPECMILSVKVLDDNGSGSTSNVASGIVYAADAGASVISLSLGGSGRSETMRSAIDYAFSHNALPVCAMGNASNASATPEPAYWFNCLSVVATDQSGNKASFSNYGVKSDVAAPGVGILSTMPTYPVTLTTNYGYSENYDALSGTSMATPLVAGIAGLVRSRNPGLDAARVKGILMAAAGDGRTFYNNLGFGRVNAAKAVAAATLTDNTPPTTNMVSPANGATLSGLVTVQAAPGDNTTVHHVDLVRDGTRFIAPLVGVSNGKNSPAWTATWSSTLVWNGPTDFTALASDVAGNVSAEVTRSFTVQNQLISKTYPPMHLCSPGTPNCPFELRFSAPTVSTEAVVRLQATVSYTAQNYRYPSFWALVANPYSVFYCGTDGTTVDCYPPVTLLPSSGSNQVGAQLNGSNGSRSGGNSEGNVTVTVTYPQ
ncbi:MAG: hypothetical protein DMG09_25400, partial [Acidobacteria bacterium]